MQILLLGKNGQLGWELNRTLAALGNLQAFDYPDIDMAKPESLRHVIKKIQPDVIVNAAAYTAVDKAESEPDLAFLINRDAPAVLAGEAHQVKAALVFVSTDYVFDGTTDKPYCEDDSPNPLNIYGKSKLGGERAIEHSGGTCLILRTSLVYSLRRDSFVTKVLQWSRNNKTLRIVTDQVSNPTWCRMLAETTAQLLAVGRNNIVGWMDERSGIYHLAGDGFTSRYEWALEILKNDPRREEQIVEHVQPALTTDFPTPAKRPLFSALNCSLFYETFGIRLPDWKHALKEAMKTL